MARHQEQGVFEPVQQGRLGVQDILGRQMEVFRDIRLIIPAGHQLHIQGPFAVPGIAHGEDHLIPGAVFDKHGVGRHMAGVALGTAQVVDAHPLIPLHHQLSLLDRGGEEALRDGQGLLGQLRAVHVAGDGKIIGQGGQGGKDDQQNKDEGQDFFHGKAPFL